MSRKPKGPPQTDTSTTTSIDQEDRIHTDVVGLSSPKKEEKKATELKNLVDEPRRLEDDEDSYYLGPLGSTSKGRALLAEKALSSLHLGCRRPAYLKFQNQFEIWKLTINSSEEDKWSDILQQIAALEEMLSTEVENTDYVTAARAQAKVDEPARQWVDYTSSDSDEDVSRDLEDLIGWDDPSVTSPGIMVPDDLEALWPRGYKIIKDMCESLGLPLMTTKKNLRSGGFRYQEIFTDPVDTAKTKYAALDKEAQASINAFKALIVFLKIQPNKMLAEDSKFAVAASYILHFLLKTGDVERDARNTKCLKHQDGGRSILESRLGRLFSVDPSIGSNLLVNLDKLYRAHARRLIDKQEISGELRDLMIRFCFTSPEGMLNKFYAKERRKERKVVTKLNSKGKPVLTTENKLVDGKRVPSLQLGSDFLTIQEKDELRKYEKRFNLAAIVKERSERISEHHEDFENLTIFAEDLVSEAYFVTKNLGSAIRQRKNQQRGRVVPIDGKVTPSAWQTALNATMEEVSDLPESIFEGIERFLLKFGR